MKIGYLCVLFVGLTACGEVLSTSDATLAAASNGDATDVDLDSCAVDRPTHVWASSADVRTRLEGTWQICTGAKIANSPRDSEGFALTGTELRFLFPRADGSLAEQDNTLTVGTWGVESEAPWRVHFDVAFATSTFDVQISEDDRVLSFDDPSRGIGSTFVRVK